MSDPFVGEIRAFPFNFAPHGWALCDGQLLPLSQNTALFSLLGTTYGGDGRSTFGLPDLRGAVAVGASPWGGPPGLSARDLGEMSGQETVTLLASEMPVHTHAVAGSSAEATHRAPQPGDMLSTSVDGALYTTGAGPGLLDPAAVGIAGSGLPHTNLMPYLTMHYCIALQGIYPPRG